MPSQHRERTISLLVGISLVTHVTRDDFIRPSSHGGSRDCERPNGPHPRCYPKLPSGLGRLARAQHESSNQEGQSLLEIAYSSEATWLYFSCRFRWISWMFAPWFFLCTSSKDMALKSSFCFQALPPSMSIRLLRSIDSP